MDIQVLWNDQYKESIPYSAMPAFRLLCHQHGIHTKWDSSQKILQLTQASLKGKQIYLSQGEGPQHSDILVKVQQFLSGTGMEVNILPNLRAAPTDGDIYLRCPIRVSTTNLYPKSILVTPANQHSSTLVLSLQKELNHIGIRTKTHKHTTKQTSFPFISVEMYLPSSSDIATYYEQFAIGISSAILRYLQERQPMTLLNSLPIDIRHSFMEVIQNTPSTLTFTHTDTPSQEEVTSEVETHTTNINQNGPRAEVYLNHHLILSRTEDIPHLILGDVCIKNTGEQELINPRICLKVKPSLQMKLSGQTLPPSMVETMGMYNTEGTQGWRYVGEDWLQKGKEQGEYWMEPIHQIHIAPGEIETHRFQLSIIHFTEEEEILVEALVQFEEPELTCEANNQISLSF